MAKAKLTKRTIDAIQPDPARDVWVWDADLPGFGVRVKPSGVRIFLVQYRDEGRRTRRVAIGQHGPVTVEKARRKALTLLGRVADGENPAAERKESAELGTIAEFADRYIEQHARSKKKSSSVRNDELFLRLYVRPRFGSLRLDALSRQDVTSLHHHLRSKATTANRVLALLSKMMNLAERWGLRPDGSNPCRHVERYREKKRERYLSSAELARLGTVLAEAERAWAERPGTQNGGESPSAIAAIRLLVFTGCRKGEILGLRWEDVDFERLSVHIPDSKTGAKTLPLNPPALEVLQSLDRSVPWVLPGREDESALVNLSKAWGRIRRRAGIADVRLHDLRHSFASVGAASGHSLVILGALLGHTQQATTQRYAHLSDNPLREASTAIAARIAAAMRQQPDAEIVPLEESRPPKRPRRSGPVRGHRSAK